MTASKKSVLSAEASEPNGSRVATNGAAYGIPLTDLNPDEPVYGLSFASGKIAELRYKNKAKSAARETYDAVDRLNSERTRRQEAKEANGRRLERELLGPAL